VNFSDLNVARAISHIMMGRSVKLDSSVNSYLQGIDPYGTTSRRFSLRRMSYQLVSLLIASMNNVQQLYLMITFLFFTGLVLGCISGTLLSIQYTRVKLLYGARLVYQKAKGVELSTTLVVLKHYWRRTFVFSSL
jgi:hypothetical protein